MTTASPRFPAGTSNYDLTSQGSAGIYKSRNDKKIKTGNIIDSSPFRKKLQAARINI